jgi:hypothetical protein
MRLLPNRTHTDPSRKLIIRLKPSDNHDRTTNVHKLLYLLLFFLSSSFTEVDSNSVLQFYEADGWYSSVRDKTDQ